MRMIPKCCTTQGEGIGASPVGFSPIDQKLVSESSLSASATAIEIGALGAAVVGPGRGRSGRRWASATAAGSFSRPSA